MHRIQKRAHALATDIQQITLFMPPTAKRESKLLDDLSGAMAAHCFVEKTESRLADLLRLAVDTAQDRFDDIVQTLVETTGAGKKDAERAAAETPLGRQLLEVRAMSAELLRAATDADFQLMDVNKKEGPMNTKLKKTAEDVLESAARDRFGHLLDPVGTLSKMRGAADAGSLVTQKGSAGAELDRLAKSRAAGNGEDYFDAYEAVSTENPDLLARAITE